MHNATVQQPLKTVSLNSNLTIVMLHSEAGFVRIHNVVEFRCPYQPLKSPLMLPNPVVFSQGDDEYVPSDEENISSDEDTFFNFPVQCSSRNPLLGRKKKQYVNKRKKIIDSNPGEMNSRTFVTNDGTCWERIASGSCMRGRIPDHIVVKEKSGTISYAKRSIENGYVISSWRLFIDEPMLRHIKNRIEEEAWE
ncbi:hypothetical protein TNCV_1390181 [Trichonephila clavipes]|nr:hypothetical protein TNCV_1390181 [Trichonephila clavipes]